MNKKAILNFSSKAKTLQNLSTILLSAKIVPLIYFSVEDWNRDSGVCLSRILHRFVDTRFIVRSSCNREDGNAYSNAGVFLSIQNVKAQELTASIEKVIKSYVEPQDDDEVLIQPMLEKVKFAGVAFSHDPTTCSPYRIINWADGDKTDVITGGGSGRVWQQAAQGPIKKIDKIGLVLNLLEELSSIFGEKPIDCEFAVTEEAGLETIWLLQARPLVMAEVTETREEQERRLRIVEEKVFQGLKRQPFLMGDSTVYGVMPDWNPAEIIGIRPKPLSLSLYRELITDSTWAYQRNNYGYRNLRSFPLLVHFFGLPYIDVRVSFNSFIPEDLNMSLANRLVDYYMSRLVQNPQFHDKVEFEIVFSCYTPDICERIKVLDDHGFSRIEQKNICQSLLQLTTRIIDPDAGLWQLDKKKLKILNSRRENLKSQNIGKLEKIYWLIEDAKRYGTLPFAGLARAGFIAVQLLRSFVSIGLLKEDEYSQFMMSVDTVSSQLARDRDRLKRQDFIKKYGHLRPGTYDVLSERYDEAPDLYFNWERPKSATRVSQPFEFSNVQMRGLDKLIREHKLNTNAHALLDFIKSAIELRELAKFYFTKNLSDALQLMIHFCEEKGVGREDLSYCNYNVFKEIYIGGVDVERALKQSVLQGRDSFEQTKRLALPPVITDSSDVWSFEWPLNEPNYVTLKQAIGPVVHHQDRQALENAIVFIPNADPGFDWLFSYPIAGLITAWGGANSHMAIRAGEIGLPAAIGAGEILYNTWKKANVIILDCAGRRVEILS